MTMPTPAATGRGAWTKRGNLLGEINYKRGCGRAVESAQSQDEWAVGCAVDAIRDLLKYNGFPVDHTGLPGQFGPRTRDAVKAFKTAKAFKEINGSVGIGTSKALLRTPVADFENKWEIPGRLLWGVIGTETAWDLGAVGYSTPYDVGICQFNLKYNTEYPAERYVAMPTWALNETARRLRARFAEYSRITSDKDVAWNAAVLSHNSPVNALKYVKEGAYPTAQAASYVGMVKKSAAVK
jgi:peptidoglycan hydrolase-like protein with peptidoglycan-binding domain